MENYSQNRILFIHIPKSAGSSFRETLIKPNNLSYKNYRGIRKLIFDYKKINAIGGHMPYGVHLFFREYQYITFLRDPVQRAISHYFFMKQKPIGKYPNANKPHRTLHNKTKLEDIFKATQFHKYYFSVFSLIDNLQTRYLAGYKYFWMPSNSNVLLNAAMNNLRNNISLFGIKEDYDNSLKIFENYFNWKRIKFKSRLRNTRIDKKVSEKELQIIKQNNKLDIILYDYALELYEKNKKLYL